MNKKQNQAQPNTLCPECDTPLPIKETLKIGDVVECPACGTESEILSLSPLKLAPLEEEK